MKLHSLLGIFKLRSYSFFGSIRGLGIAEYTERSVVYEAVVKVFTSKMYKLVHQCAIMSGTLEAFMPLIYLGAGALGSMVAWLVLGPLLTGYGFKRLVRKAAEGDPKSLETFYHVGDLLIKWAAEERIRTGEKVKVATDKVDAEGKTIFREVDEVLSPIQLMARTIGSYVIMKFKGSVGGTKNQMKQMLMDEAAETGIGLSPAALQALARGKVGPALAEVGLPFITQALNKKKEGINTQEGGVKW